MSNLLIVESAAKARTLKRYLGNDFEVIASIGHIMELPSKNGSIDTDNDFHMKFIFNNKAKSFLDKVSIVINKIKTIYLATDLDREGEGIASSIFDFLNKEYSGKSFNWHRITFTEITKESILNSLKEPREINANLVDAQKTRRALDYLVGFNISPVLWRKLSGSKSAGRVQSVALRISCEREKEIFDFVIQEYWVISGNFLFAQNKELTCSLYKINNTKVEKLFFKTKADVEKCIDTINSYDKWKITEIEKSVKKRNPYPPFITSTIQQEVVSKLGFSAKKTMSILQKLYEGLEIDNEIVGLVTYIRTDSTFISAQAIEAIRLYIKNNYSSKYLNKDIREYKKKVKNAQEAHEAIRPTIIDYTPAKLTKYLDKDELRVYQIIWNRTVASQMSEALINNVKLFITNEDSSENKYIFCKSYSIMSFDGFYILYDKEEDYTPLEEASWINTNIAISSVDISYKNNFTKPLSRYTEGSLIKRMEELGIGRPSTYAPIISILKEREYININKKSIHPSARGMTVNEFLCNYFAQYIDYGFTANMENDLDNIATGDARWIDLLRNFWNNFIIVVNNVSNIPINDVSVIINKNLLKYFLSHSEYNLQGNHSNQDGYKCNKCNEGLLVIKFSRHGLFIGCGSYPLCPNIINIKESDSELIEGNNKDSLDKNTHLKFIQKYEIEPDNFILLKKGPFGLYLEKTIADGKYKRVPIPNNIDCNLITMEIAKSIMDSPKNIGKAQLATDKPINIVAKVGSYGPYIEYGLFFVKLKSIQEFIQLNLDIATGIIEKFLNKNTIVDYKGFPVIFFKNKKKNYLFHKNKNIEIDLKKLESIKKSKDLLEIEKIIDKGS